MKTHITRWMIGAVLLTAQLLGAQTADQLVTDGRAFLAMRNLTNAHAKFTAAVAASPNHENANGLVAVTRLLNLLYQTPTRDFLTRLGVSANGRDVYHWNATLPQEATHIPVAPVGVSGGEFNPFWRTNALPEITNALANLARITTPGFLLSLTDSETTAGAVTVDYGDVLMLRSGLHFMEYFSYTLMAHDLNAQLTAIRALYANGHFNIERLLADHPQLLAFATTNDMVVARAAFVNFVDRYADASDLLRARPAGVTRLFNFVANNDQTEPRFRQTLADLKTSLNGATVLSVNGDYTFFAGAHFSGRSPLRSFLPQFRGHRNVLGTLPDPTFGGLLIGHTADEVEDLFLESKRLRLGGASVPIMRRPEAASGQPFRFSMRARSGRGYVVQASTNLLNWENVGAFIALSGAVDFTEAASQQPRRFYRIVDQDRSMPVPGNNNFANRTVIPGGTALGYNRGANTEIGEPSLASGRSVWFTWTAPASGNYVAKVDAKGFNPAVAVYTGSSVGALLQAGAGRFGGNASFNAVAGTTYAVKVDSEFPFPGQNAGLEGGFKLTLGQLPTIAFTSPANFSTFDVGSVINLQLTAADPEGALTKVELRDDQAGLLAVLTTPPFNFTWTNAPQGFRNLTATATDSSGLTATAFLTQLVRPVNDMFVARTSLTGAVVQVSGQFVLATREVGEPNHNGPSRSLSVWFEWTAPSNGSYVISAASRQVANTSQTQAPLLAVYTNLVSRSTNLFNATDIFLLPNTTTGAPYVFTRLNDSTMRVVITYPPFGDRVTNTYVFAAADRGTFTSEEDFVPTVTGAFTDFVYGVSGPPGTGFAPTALNGVSLTMIDTTASLPNLRVVPGGFIGIGNLPSQTTVNAQAGMKYFIALEQYSFPDYDYALAIIPTQPPVVSLSAPTSGSTLYTTSSIPITATASDPDGTVVEMRLYVGGVLRTNSAGSSLQATLNNLSSGGHLIDALAIDNSGAIAVTSTNLNVVAPPPLNDEFASATVISGTIYSTSNIDTTGATRETGEPSHAARSGSHSVWWVWTAPSSGTAQISISSSFATAVGVYTGPSVGSLIQVASGGGIGTMSFNAVSGTTYYIAVDEFNTGSPGSIFSFGLTLQTPPQNDAFANAIVISGGSYGSSVINNALATKETGEPNHNGRTGGKSLWWSWTAPKTGTVTIDTIGSSYDTVMGVYTGTSVNGLSFIASDDDSGGSATSRVSFTATSGVTYRIAVDSYGTGSSGNVRLNLSQP